MSNITFTNVWPHDIKHVPKPAEKDLPKWYKDTATYLPEGFPSADKIHPVKGTIKKCMPVFDALTSGYLLYTPYDLVISQVDGHPYYDWLGQMDMVQFHPVHQAERHPLANTINLPKFMNPWAIKTPNGYSVLITHPFHREDLPFTTLSGVIDSDTYVAPINFVFSLKDPQYEGLIPAGTPMCQVTPIKREKWKMTLGEDINRAEAHRQMWLLNKIEEFKYKKSWWSRKNYS